MITLIVWVSGLLYNQEDFEQMEEKFYRRSVPIGYLYMQLKLLWPFITLPLRSFSNIAKMWLRKIYWSVKNVHMHRNPETLTTFFSSRTKLIIPSWLLGFQHDDRDTQFFLCWLFHLTPPRTAHLVDPIRLASPRSRNQLASSSFKSQLCFFFFFQKSPKILSPSLPGMTSFTSPVLFSIRGFYYDICDCHFPPPRALNVCPYPCIKPNSYKPN